MLALSSASAEMCDLLNPNACGLYDCGGNSWSPDETEGNGDNLSLRSGQVDMIGASRVCMNVTGPGLIKFFWKVDSLAQHVGTLGFWVDNSKVAVCKSQEWAPVSYTLREKRDYDLAWQFYKFKSIPAGMGGGLIKNIEVINELYNGSKQIEDHATGNEIDSLPNLSNDSANMIFPENHNASLPNITMNVKLCPNINISINMSLNANDSDSGAKGRNKQFVTSYDDGITTDKTEVMGGLHEVHVYANESNCSDCCQRIRDAIKYVETGGVVRIHNGTYNCTDQPININKPIHMIGENRSNTTIQIQSNKGIYIEHDNNTTIENISLVCDNPSQSATVGIHAVFGEYLTIEHCNISDFTIGICINDTARFSIKDNNIKSIRESNYFAPTQDYGHHKSIMAILINKHNWIEYSIDDNLIENNAIFLGESDNIRSYGIWLGEASYVPGDLTAIWRDNNITHNSINVNCCKIYRKNGETCDCNEEDLCL